MAAVICTYLCDKIDGLISSPQEAVSIVKYCLDAARKEGNL